MKFFSELRQEAHRLTSGFALAGAGCGLLLSLVTVLASGHFYVYSLLYKPKHCLPAFVFFLIYVFLSALIGYASGVTFSFSCKSGGRFGAIFFPAAALTFLILWYISLFAALSFIFALFLLLCALLLEVFALREAWLRGVIPVILTALGCLGILYFVWFNVSVILLN